MTDARLIERFPAGDVALPPSKSASHRLAVCAALAAIGGGGESLLRNLGRSQDVDATVACLERLGARFVPDANGMRVLPVRADAADAADAALDCAESGSTLRFLIPVAAMLGGEHIFTGRGRLLQRPLDVYARLFAQKGLPFAADGQTVRVAGPLPAGEYALPGDVSSQFVSGLLFALPLAAGDSAIIMESALESRAYVDLALEALRQFGVTARWRDERHLEVPGGQRYLPAECTVEGDWSQAAFFLAAGALGRPVRCLGLAQSTRQGDAAVAEVLRRMGARLCWEDGALAACRAPHEGAGRGLRAVTVDAREVPDLVPVLAALFCFCAGESRIVNAGRLRLKESDRLHALATELAKLGADIAERPDGLVIRGGPRLHGGEVDAHGDHRIAMALAVAAIGCEGPVRLTGWRSVEKSYPGFWADFEQTEREAAHV